MGAATSGRTRARVGFAVLVAFVAATVSACNPWLPTTATQTPDGKPLPHLRLVGYWGANVLSSDQGRSRSNLAIVARDSNVLPIGTLLNGVDANELDRSFRNYARDAMESRQWLFINLAITHNYTCPDDSSDATFHGTVDQLFQKTREFLDGAYTSGRSMRSRVAMIQIADEPEGGGGCQAGYGRLDELTAKARAAFGRVPLMINYMWFDAGLHVPADVDFVGVDPYFRPNPGGGLTAFHNQVDKRVQRAKAVGKPVVLIPRSFSDHTNPECTTHEPLLTATQERYYYDEVARNDPQIMGILWGWVFDDLYAGSCLVAFSGVLHDPAVRELHEDIGRAISSQIPRAPETSLTPAPNVVRDGSFEAGGGSGWTIGGATNYVVYDWPGIPADGVRFGATNTYSPGGSLYQDVRLSTSSRDAVVASTKVRAQGASASGVFCVWGLDGTIEQSCQNYNVTGDRWQQLQVVLNPHYNHSQIRVQFYPAIGGVTTLVDQVAVHADRTLSNGSFDWDWTYWNATGAGTNFAVYNDGGLAHDGSRYGATNTPTSGGGIYQDVSTTIKPGAPTTATAWVRGQNGPASGTFCLWGLDGGALEPSCRSYNVGSAQWEQLQVVINPTRWHTTVRVQFYPNAGTTFVDSVSLDR